MEISPRIEKYFTTLEGSLAQAVERAGQARERGADPTTVVEIPVANGIAERVETLLGIRGVATDIRKLEEEMSREEVALAISRHFVERRFGETTREEVLEHAIRTAMALLTEGVVAAPTEGIAKVGIGKNDDNTEYLKIYYAGPIRSAGGTAQVLSVLVGDYVRRALGIDCYKSRPDEVERYIEEIRQYNSRHNLQYLPKEEEIRLIVTNCPVCIDGEATEDEEVSGYRNLSRIETNSIRGGMALVIAEGIALKAPKLQKYVKKLEVSGWEWLEGLSAVTKKGGDDSTVVKPRDKYLQDLIGGRPVFAHPTRRGGFRLRYGRSRNSGFAAAGLNPSTMHLLGGFLAVGTQMKVERPGKAVGVVPVDSIEGPTVRLASGEVLRIDNAQMAEQLNGQVESILDIGELLVSYGEFLENNHPLMPVGYCEEWWRLEGGQTRPETELEAIELAFAGVPLHPSFTYLWDDCTCAEIEDLTRIVAETGSKSPKGLILPRDRAKDLLEKLLIPHTADGDILIIRDYFVLLACLGLTHQLQRRKTWDSVPKDDPVHMVSHLAGFNVRPKGGTRIGGRMGRPGKSKPREMSPPPHTLFPLGDAGGSRRSFQEASGKKTKVKKEGGFSETAGLIDIEVGERRCAACGITTYKNRCTCGAHTLPVFRCPKCNIETPKERCPRCGIPTACQQKDGSSVKVRINVKEELAGAVARLGMNGSSVSLVKGVKGVISRERAIEPIEKGVLRSRNELFVFKDGTIRYDMIDLPLTHFRPREIGVGIDVLHRLGYVQDCDGNPLERDDQVLELRTQDILISEKCAEYMIRVSQFIDELLEKFYKLPPFYRVKTRDDLIGHLFLGLAPHTSAGVLARLIGFSRANVGYAHPFFHAAKRRNCFHADTPIEVFDGKTWMTQPVRELVLENFDVSRPELDRLGTYASAPQKLLYVRATDAHGTVRIRRITSVSIHKSPASLIRFETEGGRVLAVTPDHAMLVWEVNYLRRTKALEVHVGDSVPAAAGGAQVPDRITSRDIVPTLEDSVYCLTVDTDHSLVAGGIFTG
ncbi:MAG: DNA polymerase II large subunit, partial [Methanomicrobiales archaeon]|nr:DNA polymerase II large subunit [Methanomicrobiales archaeon]